MKQSYYIWVWRVLSVLIDIAFFGWLGFIGWNYIFNNPDKQWPGLVFGWFFLITGLFTMPLKVYFDVKSYFSTPIKPKEEKA
jgi:hypothetical protein